MRPILNKNEHIVLKLTIISTILLNSLVFSQPLTAQLIKQNNRILNEAQIKNFKQKLNGRSLEGKWNCIQQLFYEPSECHYFNIPLNKSDQINLYDGMIEPQSFFNQTNQATMQGFFWPAEDIQIMNKLYLILYRQKYRNKQAIQFNLDLNQAHKFQFQLQKNQSKLILFKQDKLISTVTLFDKEQELVKFDITLDIQIFMSSKNYQTYINSPSIPVNVPLNIRLFSKSIQFGAQISYVSYKDIVTFLLIICLIQTALIFINPSSSKQNVSHTRTIMFRISQWLILQMYAFIFYFAKLYINLALKYFDNELGYLIYVGLLNIGIGMLFLRKYQMVLQKFTNKWTLLTAVFFVVIYFILASYYLNSVYFWILEVSIMMQLQILHSMINGGKGGLPIDLIGYIVLSRIPLIYLLTSSQNIFKIPPSSMPTIYLLIAVFIFLWGIIYIQSRKGGQFMIPNELIPGFYNYYYFQSSESQRMKEQCPICTTQMNKAPDSALQMTEVQSSVSSNLQTTQIETSQQMEDAINKMTRFMKTPCGHIFHIDCLTKWMQAKLVCPYCRSTLPQLASLQKQ